MRTRAERRHNATAKMWRRLKEHQAQESVLKDFCPCNFVGKRRARFKEQPQVCSCLGCGNPRRHKVSMNQRLTLQELRAIEADRAE